MCDGYRKHRVLLLSAALHVNWVALADIHFMLAGGHGHQRGSTISRWEMSWEGKDSGWLLGSSGIVHGDRLGMVRLFCTPRITLYRQTLCNDFELECEKTLENFTTTIIAVCTCSNASTVVMM
jgi:hypothetical protein